MIQKYYTAIIRGFKDCFSVLFFMLSCLFLNLMLLILLQLVFFMSLGFRVTVKICSSSLAFPVWTGRELKESKDCSDI